jgi:hypothetical protein
MDVDDSSENDCRDAPDTLPDEHTEDIIGFSIGQEQLRMKSPETPALEKAKALDQSKNYFDLEPEEGNIDNGEASPQEYEADGDDTGALHHSLVGERFEGPESQISPSKPSPVDTSRSSTSKSNLKDGFGQRTRRASSESTGMVGALKKLLPDLPSFSLSKAPSLPTFGFGSKSQGENQSNRPKRSNTLLSRSNLPWNSSNQLPDSVATTPETTQGPIRGRSRPNGSPAAVNGHTDIKDGATSRNKTQEVNAPSPRPTANRRLLRRATSENSLFMRNDLERTTTQDDIDKWANVSEQINSRFKAITDSLQDSAVSRLPKMPSVSLGSFKPGLPRSNSDAARLNTNRNVALTKPDIKMKEGGTNAISAPSAAKQTKHSHPILSTAMSDLTGDVVVLGGYRGSVLRSAKPPNKQLWVPVKVSCILEDILVLALGCMADVSVS